MLQLKNVGMNYRYDQVTLCALKGVSLDFLPGKFTSLVGKSGSGKTSLLQLGGLLQKPTSGAIIFEGVDISRLDDNECSELRLHMCGFVFQSYHLLPVLNCAENIALPALFAGKKDSISKSRARELLAAVGLEDFDKRDIRSLSGGQRQRVAVARALINSPKIIFADEPTANLDAESSEKVMELLIAITRQLKTALILATHDKECSARADIVVEVVDGEVSQKGTH